MAKYIKISNIVEAEKFESMGQVKFDNKTALRYPYLRERWKITGAYNENEVRYWIIPSENGEIEVQEGYWIITDIQTGERNVCSPELFEQSYKIEE